MAALTAGPAAAATGSTTVEQADPAGELTLDVTNETDDTVTLTLSTTAENVAGYQAHLQFDPEATAVQSVSGGEPPFSADPVATVDNENGSVHLNQVADDSSVGTDAPTMATITFEAADAPTDVTFVAADSLVATSEAEAVTDLRRDGVTLDGGGDGGDGGDAGGPGGGALTAATAGPAARRPATTRRRRSRPT
ncbi:cohesin domain-containing protein [Halorubrum sp. LN27]|uniref:cohesin domain-containing protein n=1 Tax=Halorubrum sp. LN27 TaxID=2801032 RepID=UPI001F2C8040|nr:cohesin domain-containing protein [Halorubrum sp. LN27]